MHMIDEVHSPGEASGYIRECLHRGFFVVAPAASPGDGLAPHALAVRRQGTGGFGGAEGRGRGRGVRRPEGRGFFAGICDGNVQIKRWEI